MWRYTGCECRAEAGRGPKAVPEVSIELRRKRPRSCTGSGLNPRRKCSFPVAMAAAAARARAAQALDAAVPRDVVLFRHERGSFFRLAGLFCAGQGVFWASLAHSAFTGLRPPPPGVGPDDPLRPRDNKWRWAFTAACATLGRCGIGRSVGSGLNGAGLRPCVRCCGAEAPLLTFAPHICATSAPSLSPPPAPHLPLFPLFPLSAPHLSVLPPPPAPFALSPLISPSSPPHPSPPIGSLIVAAGCFIPLRSVRRLTLHRGGSTVTISTHGPMGLGPGLSFTVPLRHLSCRAHRSDVRTSIPLKVKGRIAFFLLDARGQLDNPRLFDITVGAYRKL